jgi:hypothetical protein
VGEQISEDLLCLVSMKIIRKLLGVLRGIRFPSARVASRRIGYIGRSDLLLLNVAKKYLPAAKT